MNADQWSIDVITNSLNWNENKARFIYVTDKAWGQWGWILTEFFFYFFAFFMNRDEVEVHKRRKKNKANIQSSWPNMFGQLKYSKNISLSIRININLFISRAGKESQMCLWHNTSARFVHVPFVLTFFCRFCSFISDMSDFWKFALRTFFLTLDQSTQSRAGKMGSCWLLK